MDYKEISEDLSKLIKAVREASISTDETLSKIDEMIKKIELCNKN